MWVQIPPREGAILMAEMARPGHARTCSTVNVFKATQQGQHRYSADAKLGVLDWGTHWHPLANMTEPSVRIGDAALCQITLITGNVLRRLSNFGMDEARNFKSGVSVRTSITSQLMINEPHSGAIVAHTEYTS